MRSLHVAFLEPWYGGSHRAFLDAWARRSRHRVTVHGLAPRHWKWRQEASAWELARAVDPEAPPDVLACSGYVDVPRLHGFLPRGWAGRPTLVYFHETQLTYPESPASRASAPAAREGRDLTHGFSNVLSAIRADRAVFNSAHHLDEFRGAADEVLRRLPRPSPRRELSAALERASVVPPMPELEDVPLGPGHGGPLRVAFPHRLEHDKDPEAFARAVRAAAERGARLEVELLGGAPEKAAAVVEQLRPWVRNERFVEDRGRYLEVLGRCDVVASTALHEFFGVAFTEAMAAGCAPLAPSRLNYPSLLEPYDPGGSMAGAYADDADLVHRLTGLALAPDRVRGPARRAAARDAVLPLDAAGAAVALDGIVDELGP